MCRTSGFQHPYFLLSTFALLYIYEAEARRAKSVLALQGEFFLHNEIRLSLKS